jgi:hypothetical protein
MPIKKNPLKLNKLQLRSLALAQVLAADPELSSRDDETGDIKLLHLPHAHGDHMHIGGFTVPARDASGLTNPAVWVALERKGLAVDGGPMVAITLTPQGIDYDTGLSDQFITPSDH